MAGEVQGGLLHSGLLDIKLGGKWQRRLFCVYPGRLIWFKEDSETEVDGEVPLDHSSEVRVMRFGLRKFMFEVDSSGKIIKLAANGDAEKLDWIQAIEAGGGLHTRGTAKTRRSIPRQASLKLLRGLSKLSDAGGPVQKALSSSSFLDAEARLKEQQSKAAAISGLEDLLGLTEPKKDLTRKSKSRAKMNAVVAAEEEEAAPGRKSLLSRLSSANRKSTSNDLRAAALDAEEVAEVEADSSSSDSSSGSDITDVSKMHDDDGIDKDVDSTLASKRSMASLATGPAALDGSSSDLARLSAAERIQDKLYGNVSFVPSAVPKCYQCKKKVYGIEQVIVDGKKLHKSCFRCAECDSKLSPNNFSNIGDKYYCRKDYLAQIRSTRSKSKAPPATESGRTSRPTSQSSARPGSLSNASRPGSMNASRPGSVSNKSRPGSVQARPPSFKLMSTDGSEGELLASPRASQRESSKRTSRHAASAQDVRLSASGRGSNRSSGRPGSLMQKLSKRLSLKRISSTAAERRPVITEVSTEEEKAAAATATRASKDVEEDGATDAKVDGAEGQDDQASADVVEEQVEDGEEVPRPKSKTIVEVVSVKTPEELLEVKDTPDSDVEDLEESDAADEDGPEPEVADDAAGEEEVEEKVHFSDAEDEEEADAEERGDADVAGHNGDEEMKGEEEGEGEEAAASTMRSSVPKAREGLYLMREEQTSVPLDHLVLRRPVVGRRHRRQPQRQASHNAFGMIRPPKNGKEKLRHTNTFKLDNGAGALTVLHCSSQTERDVWMARIANAVHKKELEAKLSRAQRIDMMSALQAQAELANFLKSADLEYSGYMEVMTSKKRHVWKRRFFELKADALRYYNDAKKKKKPTTFIFSDNCAVLDLQHKVIKAHI